MQMSARCIYQLDWCCLGGIVIQDGDDFLLVWEEWNFCGTWWVWRWENQHHWTGGGPLLESDDDKDPFSDEEDEEHEEGKDEGYKDPSETSYNLFTISIL